MATCLRHALEQIKVDAAWDVWVSMYPYFNEENFKSFNDFKEEACKPQIQLTDKTDDEIIEEMEAVINAHEKQKRGET